MDIGIVAIVLMLGSGVMMLGLMIAAALQQSELQPETSAVTKIAFSLWKIRNPLTVIAFIALAVVIVLGYWFNLPWVGVTGGYSKITTTSTTHGMTTATEQPQMKTLWDWLQLLIIPTLLAIGVFLLNRLQRLREERTTAQRDKTEREMTLDKQREDLLQTYLDRMSELLLEKQLHTTASPYDDPYEIRNVTRDEVRNVARVRTIMILFQLDARRIGYVFAFLREAGLMSTTSESIVSLKDANLTKINFSQAVLTEVDLRDTNLREADFSGADLLFANLSGVNLSGANLTGVIGMTTEELEKQAKSLKGATMPDGSKHP